MLRPILSILFNIDIIVKNPIGNGLDTFRYLFRAKCKDYGARDLALELILALEFNVRLIILLFKKVNSYVSDLEIYNSFNSASIIDTSNYRKDVNPILKAEVEDNLIIDYLKFFNTFFREVAQLSKIATAVFKIYKDIEPPLYIENIS
ncbi:serine threonine kinase Sgk2 [Cenococcum geophilum]